MFDSAGGICPVIRPVRVLCLLGRRGRCGFRGGFMELVGFDQPMLTQIQKIMNTKLCPSTTGQVRLL